MRIGNVQKVMMDNAREQGTSLTPNCIVLSHLKVYLVIVSELAPSSSDLVGSTCRLMLHPIAQVFVTQA